MTALMVPRQAPAHIALNVDLFVIRLELLGLNEGNSFRVGPGRLLVALKGFVAIAHTEVAAEGGFVKLYEFLEIFEGHAILFLK